jgi:hypothetical protein
MEERELGGKKRLTQEEVKKFYERIGLGKQESYPNLPKQPNFPVNGGKGYIIITTLSNNTEPISPERTYNAKLEGTSWSTTAS